MRIKNNTDEEIVIEPGGELVVRRYLTWIDDERELKCLTIDRVKGQPIVTEQEIDGTEQKHGGEVNEMIEHSSILNEKRDESDDEPEFYCHYTKNGERCDKPCKNLKGLKIHWGKTHKDKEFYLPEQQMQ